MADRARTYEIGVRARDGVTDLAMRFVESNGAEVQHGPFAGLRYPRERLAEVDAPVAKLVGAYEAELADQFVDARARGVRSFIDVGCADGYYAVGLPHASPSTTSFAYDIAPSARRLCGEVAALNGVTGRVRVGGRFTFDGLPSTTGLMLVDIEGEEVNLFGPDTVDSLGQMHVLVEVHEDVRPDAGRYLIGLFAGTHRVDVIGQRPRSADEYPALHPLSAGERQAALAEYRGPELRWLMFSPSTPAAPS